jgi:uncharacterized membrane protein
MAGVGGIVGHFWHGIPREQVQEVSRLLHTGESGLLAVLANWHEDEVAPLLEHAEHVEVVRTTVGNLDDAFDRAVKDAGARAAVV